MIIGFGELEEELKQLVIKLNLSDRVIFTGYREDAKDLLYCANLFAFPSLQEGLPASLMEAMSVGLPVVASNIRGNVDLIKNEENGLLYDCNDVDGFKNGILKIRNDKRLQQNMIINNKKIIRNFDISIVNSNMYEIYKNLNRS